jgi:hypothetical protein
MKYITLIFAFAFASCSPSYNYSYFGAKGTKTKDVAVYINANQILKPYKIIGKFFSDGGVYDENFQKKAIAKAKKVGADAICFKEVEVVVGKLTIIPTEPSSNLFDSIINILVGSKTKIKNVIERQMDAYFLKYQ